MSVLRQTAYVVDPATAAASLTVARQPVRASCLQVAVSSGTTGSGTVTITGTVDGASDSEVLTFTANATKTTERVFTAVASVATSGLHDEATPPTVSVKAVGVDGAPQATTYTVASGVGAAFGRARGSWPSRHQGSHEEEAQVAYLDHEEGWTPRVGDLVQEFDTGDRWLVRGVRRISSDAIPHHWECDVTRYTS